MINLFSKQRTSRQEWQSRARALLQEFERYSLDELLRGGSSKRGQTSDGGGDGYDPHQPRVPAGHPDGGQWTAKAAIGSTPHINDPRILADALPSNHWIVGVRYAAAVGHHDHPRQHWKNLPLRPETREVFDKAVSGPLEVSVYNPVTRKISTHRWDKEHQEYNKAVGELFQMFLEGLRSRGITVEKLTPDHAREFLAAIHRSQDPRISNYLAMIKFLRSMRLLRGRE